MHAYIFAPRHFEARHASGFSSWKMYTLLTLTDNFTHFLQSSCDIFCGSNFLSSIALKKSYNFASQRDFLPRFLIMKRAQAVSS